MYFLSKILSCLYVCPSSAQVQLQVAVYLFIQKPVAMLSLHNIVEKQEIQHCTAQNVMLNS
jgi:hypothetical protein